MKLAYNLSSTSPKIKKYKIGTASLTTAGIPILVSQTGAGGVVAATTTGGVDCLGVSLDTAVYTTTQAASMVEGVVSVVINPDAVWAALMSGAAASGTALNTTTNSAASAGGTVITYTAATDVAPNSPTMLDGVAYCISGNNAGLSRKITSVAATTATVVVPFPFAIAVGDVFILSPFNCGGLTSIGGTSITLTTALDGARGDLASTTAGFTARHVDVSIDYQGAPRTNSYLFTMPFDHVFALNT